MHSRLRSSPVGGRVRSPSKTWRSSAKSFLGAEEPTRRRVNWLRVCDDWVKVDGTTPTREEGLGHLLPPQCSLVGILKEKSKQKPPVLGKKVPSRKANPNAEAKALMLACPYLHLMLLHFCECLRRRCAFAGIPCYPCYLLASFFSRNRVLQKIFACS